MDLYALNSPPESQAIDAQQTDHSLENFQLGLRQFNQSNTDHILPFNGPVTEYCLWVYGTTTGEDFLNAVVRNLDESTLNEKVNESEIGTLSTGSSLRNEEEVSNWRSEQQRDADSPSAMNSFPPNELERTHFL